MEDPGIGMSKNDLINHLVGAKSGTKAFMEAMAAGGDISMMGQFGVGFHSAHLAVDKTLPGVVHAAGVSVWIPVLSVVGAGFAVGLAAVGFGGGLSFASGRCIDGISRQLEAAGDLHEDVKRGTEVFCCLKEDLSECIEVRRHQDLGKKHPEFFGLHIEFYVGESREKEATDSDEHNEEKKEEGDEPKIEEADRKQEREAKKCLEMFAATAETEDDYNKCYGQFGKRMRLLKVTRFVRILSMVRSGRVARVQAILERGVRAVGLNVHTIRFTVGIARLAFSILWLNHLGACLWWIFVTGTFSQTQTGKSWHDKLFHSISLSGELSMEKTLLLVCNNYVFWRKLHATDELIRVPLFGELCHLRYAIWQYVNFLCRCNALGLPDASAGQVAEDAEPECVPSAAQRSGKAGSLHSAAGLKAHDY